MIQKPNELYNQLPDPPGFGVGLTPQEHAIVTQEYATYGANPRKEQVTRRKKAVNHLELAQEEISRMGAIYVEFGESAHSEYLISIYSMMEMVKTLLKEFAGDQ
jgi:hypothetical protein